MIKRLDELKTSDRMSYGNKAYNLALLSNTSAIPQGAALSVEEFDSFLQLNNFHFTYDEYIGRNREIKEFIRTSSFSAETLTIITDTLKKLGNSKYAVRSSSLCEDSNNYSMAGIFDSFVGLSSVEEVMEAIKGCYLSLFSDKVLDYFENHSIELPMLKMGVIVQRYIEGVFSGVIFTADTKEQNTNRIVISYTEGKCSNFVEGKQESAYVILDKFTGNIIETNEIQGKFILPDTLRRKLVNIALNIEKDLGYEADMEWTFDGRQVYVLQARPITTLKDKSGSFEIEQNDMKYSWFLCEPKPMLPLLQSYYDEYFSASGDGILITGYTSRYVLHKIVNGYLYLRSGTLENEKAIRENFEQHLRALTDKGKNIFVDEVLPKLSQLISKMLSFMQKNLDAAEIVDFIETALEYNKAAIRGHWLSIFGEKYLDEFKVYITELLGDMDTENFYDLVYVPTLKTKERERLFQIADFIKADNEQLSIVNSSHYLSIIYARLKLSKNWDKLIQIINKYLEQYGMEFAGEKRNPANNLLEKPQFVLDKVIPLINEDSKAFYQSTIKIKENKLKWIQIIRSTINEEKYNEFQQKLNLAEEAFITIDDHHYYCEDIPWGYLKTALNTASLYLASNGVISMPDQLYYLSFNELFNILKGRIKCPNIDRRKANYRRQEKLLAPGSLGITPKPYSIISAEFDLDKDNNPVLTGLSSLKKIVKGKVLIGPAVPDQIKEECILVVNNGHMGDLFSVIEKIKGLIVTGGSPFDHMGIITREMGIPALYYVEHADTRLKTDDEVILNGIEGFVKIIR